MKHRARGPLGIAALSALFITGSLAQADDATVSATNSSLTATGLPATNSPALSDDPDQAWKQVQKANQPPFPPSEWNTKPPTQQEQDYFYAPKLLKAANLAMEFYTRYPNHPKAPAAREMERQLLKLGIQKFDQTNQTARLAGLEEKQLQDPNASEDEKVRIRMEKVTALAGGFPGTLDAFVNEGRALTKDYPKRPEGWNVLMFALSHTEGDKSDTLAKEITTGSAPEEIKAQVKIQQRMAEVRNLVNGLPETQAALEKAARETLRDFPDKDLGYQLLLILMRSADPEKAQALGKEIAGSQAPDSIKTQAQQTLKDLGRLNQPVDIQYSALDGREVNLNAMKGKVVLVDFWATWCGPCMAELPEVKEAYAKFHDQGFEIIGISLDEDKLRLETTLKTKGMTWPQFFDGQGWQNKYAKQFGVMSIPAMWLVDKQGKLADMDARSGLEGKISKLLAKK